MTNKDACRETNSMKAFYASLESSETISLSHVYYRPSEKTKKQFIFSKNYSQKKILSVVLSRSFYRDKRYSKIPPHLAKK
jgi:hypothetical protein